MKTLAAVILALVAMAHYGGDLLSLGYPDPDRARKSIFYVLRSFEGATQYALIALLALEVASRQTVQAFGWRENRATEPSRRSNAVHAIPSVVLVVLACGWGLIEQVQAGACRLAIGLGAKPPAAAPLTGLCDDVTGLPMYALGLAAGAFIAAVIAAYSLGEKNA